MDKDAYLITAFAAKAESEPIHNTICNKCQLTADFKTGQEEDSSEQEQYDWPEGEFLRSDFPEALPALFLT